MTNRDDGMSEHPLMVARTGEMHPASEHLPRRTRTRAANRTRTRPRSVKPVPDPQTLPPTFPVQTASRILGIGRNRTYELIKSDSYPVRVIESGGRYRVSRWDLLKYLGATPGDAEARK